MLNNVILQGYLTNDVELKQTTNGISVCTFSLGVKKNFKNSNGVYPTDFIECSAFRTTAEFICRNLKKGQQIIVCGALDTDTYEKDGVKRKVTRVDVSNVYFCGSKNDEKEPEESSLPY